MKSSCDIDLEKIKEKYNTLKKNYDLPSWEELEEDFDISKAFSVESETTLRDIRRKINEKITSYLHLFEMFMNPQTAPLFVMNVLKNLSESDDKNIKKTYGEMARIQFQQILADTIYSEENESKVIKETFDMWAREKVNIYKIIQVLGEKYKGSSVSKNKSYFG